MSKSLALACWTKQNAEKTVLDKAECYMSVKIKNLENISVVKHEQLVFCENSCNRNYRRLMQIIG